MIVDDLLGLVVIECLIFVGLGGCLDGMCLYLIYIGGYGLLSISCVCFECGIGGYYVKSCVVWVSIIDFSFDDLVGCEINYVIDLFNGVIGWIMGNIFVVGKNKENYLVIIVVVVEVWVNFLVGLVVEGNDVLIVLGVGFGMMFVVDWSYELLKIGMNKFGLGVKVCDSC